MSFSLLPGWVLQENLCLKDKKCPVKLEHQNWGTSCKIVIVSNKIHSTDV